MDSTELMPLLGLSMLILAGGIVSSFGLNAVAKGRLGRAFIGRWRWWGLAAYYLAVTGVIVGGLAWILRSLLASQDLDRSLESPWLFLTFGVVMGLPFTLPAVTTVWRATQEAKRPKQKQKPASRQQRLEFAKDLERQLREYGDVADLHVELQGDKGTILLIRGNISREQGERLVGALRADMKAVNLHRVEGSAEGGKWWVRV